MTDEAENQDKAANRLTVRRLGIDTQYETVVFMRRDCHVCRSEGFAAHARVRLTHEGRSIIATLYQVTAELLRDGKAGLSEAAWHRLQAEEGNAHGISKLRGTAQDLAARRRAKEDLFGRYCTRPFVDT